MSANTEIEWCEHTHNIVWGCTKVSPACKHCYAESFAKRTGHDVWGADKPRRVLSDSYWKQPLKWNAAAKAAGQQARVFCSSMADVFEDHPTVDEQRDRLWPLIHATPWLQWLLLTKRPANVARMVPPSWLAAWPANVLPGFTAEDQEWFDRRYEDAVLDHLPIEQDPFHSFPRTVRREADIRFPWFVSCEPALGPIDFRGLRGVSWLIMGGESGAGARPMMLSWVRSARDQAVAAGVPFFLKQKIEGGKKISLPLLDGRRWQERARP